MSRVPHDPMGEHAPLSTPVERRRFLRGAAVVGGGVAVGAAGAELLLRHKGSGGTTMPGALSPFGRPAFDAAVFTPPGSAKVAVLRHTSYDNGLEAAVANGLTSIGADVSGAHVLLKPNFVEYDASSAINTDPRLVAAAALTFRRMGAASVTVGEGPGHRRDTQFVTASSGLLEVLKEIDVPFVDLNTDAVMPVRLHSTYTDLAELWLPQTVADADIIVSMPKMKTHHWAAVTLSLKNCFGCVPGRVYGWPKNALHWAGLQQSILDVAGAVRPDYAIVDGIVGMEGNGPISGTPVAAGLLVFGDDPVATDVTAASLMGFDPEKIDYLREAGRFLGQGDIAKIRQTGEDPAS
ncbi:MAG: hypothetical protein QOE25_455, partial [Actinomycetota bacterium]|nr:hypothetical protein [Actinomycetota bacterium]